MRVGLVSDDIKPLTRAMTRIGKDAAPIFKDVGDAVAKVAARDIQTGAGRFSRQARAAAKGVEPRRDRVPYVHTKPRAPFSDSTTKLGDVVGPAEFGSKHPSKKKGKARISKQTGRPKVSRYWQWTRKAGSGRPLRWNPSGWWFYPATRDNAEKYTGLYRRALEDLLDRALGGG